MDGLEKAFIKDAISESEYTDTCARLLKQYNSSLRDETVARVIIALLTNLTLFLVFSFLQISRLPQPAVAWPRIIFDLVCSQVVLALIAPWFFALQTAALRLAEPFAAPRRRNAD